MRNDERFEIERAFDLLPHVVGASWAVVWFRMMGIRKPTRQQYRDKSIEFLKRMEPVFDSYGADMTTENAPKFEAITKYIAFRRDREYERILSGDNSEIEKRYDRYLDYG